MGSDLVKTDLTQQPDEHKAGPTSWRAWIWTKTLPYLSLLAWMHLPTVSVSLGFSTSAILPGALGAGFHTLCPWLFSLFAW